MRKMCFLSLILKMAMVTMIVMLIAMITYEHWTGWLVMSALDEGMTMRRCLLEDRYPGWVNRSVSHITQTVNSHSILKWNINVNFSAMQAKLDLLPNLWIFTNFAYSAEIHSWHFYCNVCFEYFKSCFTAALRYLTALHHVYVFTWVDLLC